MEQKESNNMSMLSLLDPKILYPFVTQVLLRPEKFLKTLSAPPSTPFAGQYRPSFLERAAFSTDPFYNTDRSDNPQKVSFSELIRGSRGGREATEKKEPAELLMSTEDLKHQAPPLPDYSKYSVRTQEAQEQDNHNFLKGRDVESLIPQSPLVANIDRPNEGEAQRQQKDAMNYVAELNKKSVPEELQRETPINEEMLSDTPLREEKDLEANNGTSEQATDYVNSLKDFIHTDANPGTLWERFKNSEFSGHLMDFFSGLALGNTPQESFSNAAIALQQGNNARAQRKQTLKFLQSRGYSEKDAQMIAQSPDLAMKIIGSALSPQEGYRTLTKEEKAGQGLPDDMAFQVSTSTGKITPIQGGQQSASKSWTDKLGLDFGNTVSKPEMGYQYIPDKNAPNGIRAMPIAGTAAERKLIEERQKKQQQIMETTAKSELVIKTSEKLMKIVDESPHIVGGLGYWLAKIPGFEAARFGHMLETLKSNIALDALRKAKAFSPNGASGFGNLSNMELQALQNSIAALNQDLSAKQMKESLQTVIDTFNKSNAATRAILFGGAEPTRELIRAAYGEDAYKGNHAQSNDPLEKQIEALPEGVLFVDSDGRIKEKQTNG
ncbi:hypothetical protein V3564_04900 [Bartonella sp. B12(2025)]